MIFSLPPFYPQKAVARLADLGGADGAFPVDLSVRYPNACVLAAGADPLILPVKSTPKAGRLVIATGIPLDRLLSQDLCKDARSGFDRVYIVRRTLDPSVDLIGPAMEMIRPEGEIHILLEQKVEALAVAKILEAGGFEIGGAEIPFDFLPQPATVRFLPNPPTDLCWLVAQRKVEGRFPYRRSADGRYEIPGFHEKVVVLGDVAGPRTLELAAQGHQVVHIDRDPFFLNVSKRAVPRLAAALMREGKLKREIKVQYVEGDWYDTREEANYVEAFYPLTVGDVSRDPLERNSELKDFLQRAVHSKLAPGREGKGVFIISEYPNLIEEISEIIRQDPDFEVLEVQHDQTSHPIIGGHSAVQPDGKASWVIYRRQF